MFLIPYPIFNQDVLVQCEDSDLVLNLVIIPWIKLKSFPSHQIPRSIIPSLGIFFEFTLSSQLFESSCMDLCSNQAITFEIFSQEIEHGHIIGENTLHFSSWSSVMSNIFQFINLSYGWLEKVCIKINFIFSPFLSNKWAWYYSQFRYITTCPFWFFHLSWGKYSWMF